MYPVLKARHVSNMSQTSWPGDGRYSCGVVNSFRRHATAGGGGPILLLPDRIHRSNGRGLWFAVNVWHWHLWRVSHSLSLSPVPSPRLLSRQLKPASITHPWTHRGGERESVCGVGGNTYCLPNCKTIGNIGAGSLVLWGYEMRHSSGVGHSSGGRIPCISRMIRFWFRTFPLNF